MCSWRSRAPARSPWRTGAREWREGRSERRAARVRAQSLHRAHGRIRGQEGRAKLMRGIVAASGRKTNEQKLGCIFRPGQVAEAACESLSSRKWLTTATTIGLDGANPATGAAAGSGSTRTATTPGSGSRKGARRWAGRSTCCIRKLRWYWQAWLRCSSLRHCSAAVHSALRLAVVLRSGFPSRLRPELVPKGVHLGVMPIGSPRITFVQIRIAQEPHLVRPTHCTG